MTATPSPRVFLAAKFPRQFLEETVIPNLNALGITVDKIVPVDFKGDLRTDAVLFMFQYCSHVTHDQFKARCKAAGVKFVLLDRHAAGWRHSLTKAGMRLPDYVVAAKPLPVAEVPAKPPVVAEEPMEAEPVSETIYRAAHATFGEALKAARVAAGHSQADVGAVCEVDQATVSQWEQRGRATQPEHYAALLQLFPALATAPKPPFATRAWGRVKKPAVSLVPALPAPMAPVAVLKPVGRVAPPLSGLLRAARALGISGKLTVTVDDAESQVCVGAELWTGTSPDAAVETARAALDERLGVAMRRMEEARASLAGAA